MSIGIEPLTLVHRGSHNNIRATFSWWPGLGLPISIDWQPVQATMLNVTYETILDPFPAKVKAAWW